MPYNPYNHASRDKSGQGLYTKIKNNFYGKRGNNPKLPGMWQSDKFSKLQQAFFM